MKLIPTVSLLLIMQKEFFGEQSFRTPLPDVRESFIQEWQISNMIERIFSFTRKISSFFSVYSNFYEAQLHDTVFVILDLLVSSYLSMEFTEFRMNEEDKILVSVVGHYQYGDFGLRNGRRIAGFFFKLPVLPVKDFEYFFQSERD